MFSADFRFRAEGEKATSRAEPSWKSVSSSSGSSQLGSDSSLLNIFELVFPKGFSHQKTTDIIVVKKSMKAKFPPIFVLSQLIIIKNLITI